MYNCINIRYILSLFYLTKKYFIMNSLQYNTLAYLFRRLFVGWYRIYVKFPYFVSTVVLRGLLFTSILAIPAEVVGSGDSLHC